MKVKSRQNISSRRYGQFIIDFVNAKTILDAYEVLFDNLDELYISNAVYFNTAESSDKPIMIPEDIDFKEYWQRAVADIKKNYREFLGQFGEIERRVVELAMMQAEYLQVIYYQDFLQNEPGRYIVRDMGRNDDDEEDNREYAVQEIFDLEKQVFRLKSVPLYKHEKVGEYDLNHPYLNQKYKMELDTLRYLSKKYVELRKVLTREKMDQLYKFTLDKLNGYIDCHANLAVLRNIFQHAVEEICETKNMFGYVSTILNHYNANRTYSVYPQEDGKLITAFSYDEDDFYLWIDGYGGRNWSFVYKDLASYILCFCMVEFLRDHENINRLNKCTRCGQYFIQLKKGKKIFCSDKCRLAFHNRKRIESGEHAKYKREGRRKGLYQ